MKTILIDGNNQGHIHNNIGKLTVGKLPTQAIYGFTKSIREIKAYHFDCKLLTLWDGRSEWRFKMLPETSDHPGYKGDRDADPRTAAKRAELVEQRPYIEEMLEILGIDQMLVSTHEADDMAGYLVMNSAEPFELVTGDKDWLQLIRKDVTWFDPVNKQRVTYANFLEKTGYFTPQEFLQGKCLMGDTSDKVPGVGGIGEKTAPIFMAEHRNVAAFFKKYEAGLLPNLKGKKIIEFAQNGKAIFARNYKLMSLRNVEKPDPKNVAIRRGKFNESAFVNFCERLHFRSILMDMENFIKPFKE